MPSNKREVPDAGASAEPVAKAAKSWSPPTCSTCLQKAREPDAYHPERATLYWPKKGKSRTGQGSRKFAVTSLWYDFLAFLFVVYQVQSSMGVIECAMHHESFARSLLHVYSKARRTI